MKKYIIYLFLGILSLFSVVSIAQQVKSDLQKKKKQKQQEIQEIKTYISLNKNKQNQSLQILQSLTRQIYTRQSVISNLNTQVDMMESELESIEDSVVILSENLRKQKSRLSKMVVASYKNRDHYNKLVYIFSANSFNQAVNRIKYFKSLAEQRKNQLNKIIQTKQWLTDKHNRIIGVKLEKENTINEKEHERKEIENDRYEQSDVLKYLKTQEKELQQQLNERKKSMAQLDRAINDIIKKEIEEAKRKQREAEAEERRKKEEELKKQKTDGSAKKSDAELPPKSDILPNRNNTIDPLSQGFAANKNNLPWPVSRGLIVSSFGVHSHPNLKNIVIENNGVDISTAPGSNINAVYKGTVKAVVTIPGLQKMVMISHGNFYTVYCHLENVLVKVGDQVSAKQHIGTIYTDTEENQTILHFEVWKDTQKLNPEDWLGN